tara:strand:+ start:139 stop:882 length:744 start_codon:yes stop_codon:yes gene_type:complete
MHIVVGTPMYGGMCCSEYVQSLLALKEACMENGIKLTCIFLGNESLIQRGRNTIAYHFMQMEDATHLLFMDADQRFRPNDVARMIKAHKPLIGAPVPMKGINWDRVRMGATLGHPDLAALTGIYNINLLDGHEMTDPDTPFQVKHVGTGMMLIRREVFETLAPHVGVYYNGGQSIPPDAEVHDFFQVKNVDGELLSEDYFFCHNYREHGGKVWVAPWCEVGHFGSYCFNGQYAETQYGVSGSKVSTH